MKHDWKVGETYKDKAGRPYKFIAHVPEAKERCRLVFLSTENGGVTSRYENGAYIADVGSRYDILPPKTYVYVNIYHRDDVAPFAYGWSSEEEAGRHRADFSGFVRMEKIEV